MAFMRVCDKPVGGILTEADANGGMSDTVSARSLDPRQDVIAVLARIERLRALLNLQLRQIEAWDKRLNSTAPGHLAVQRLDALKPSRAGGNQLDPGSVGRVTRTQLAASMDRGRKNRPALHASTSRMRSLFGREDLPPLIVIALLLAMMVTLAGLQVAKPPSAISFWETDYPTLRGTIAADTP